MAGRPLGNCSKRDFETVVTADIFRTHLIQCFQLWSRLHLDSRFISDSINGLAVVVNVRCCGGRPSFSNARIFANPDAHHVVVGIGKKDVNNVCLLWDSQEGAMAFSDHARDFLPPGIRYEKNVPQGIDDDLSKSSVLTDARRVS